MWLLKFHLAFSILCLITGFGFSKVCKQTIIDNGWITEESKEELKKNAKWPSYLGFFVPIMNLLMVCLILVMVGMPKSKFDAYVEESKKED